MSLLKNIFDYFDGKISDDKKSEFFSNINSSDENKKKFRSVFNFKAERNILRARISQKELNEKWTEVYSKLNLDEKRYTPAYMRVRRLSIICSAAVAILFSVIYAADYIQEERQIKTMEYLATVEIKDESKDVDLVLSTGERIVLCEAKTELDKSDVKIVADKKSVSVASMHNVKEEKIVAENKLNWLSVNSKEDFLLSLEDGSRIWMRHNSKVGFPNKFSEDSRVIEFEGEGYFDIASDSLRPFIIKTKDIKAKVLGTEFNLKAQTATPIVEVSMISGKLAVEKDNSEEIILTRNHQFVLDTDSDLYHINMVDNFRYKAWSEGYFFFENDNLKDIIKLLSYMYEVEIVLESSKYDNEQFNGKMKRSNGLDKIISALKQSYDFKFHMEDGVLYIY